MTYSIHHTLPVQNLLNYIFGLIMDMEVWTKGNKTILTEWKCFETIEMNINRFENLVPDRFFKTSIFSPFLTWIADPKYCTLRRQFYKLIIVSYAHLVRANEPDNCLIIHSPAVNISHTNQINFQIPYCI